VKGISILPYNGTNITFELTNGDVMVNLTEMGKAFSKRPNDYLSLPSTNQLIDAITRKYGNDGNQIVSVVRGGTNPGTWANRVVALSFAQWLSVEFHLVCLEKIEELLTAGVATISNDDEMIAQAMNVLQRRLEESKRKVQVLEGEVTHLSLDVEILEPKAAYASDVLQSTSTYTLTQVAHDLGYRSVFVLTDKLRNIGLLFYQSGQWQPTAKVAHMACFATRTAKYIKSDGTIGTSLSTVVTEKGRMFLHDLKKGGKI
jgi:phage antirepressor YoqD-like protein